MYALCLCHSDLTRAVNALPQNMTSQMFSAIAAVTGQGQGQNANTTPAQWGSSQYGYTGGSSGDGGGNSSAYHVSSFLFWVYSTKHFPNDPIALYYIRV